MDSMEIFWFSLTLTKIFLCRCFIYFVFFECYELLQYFGCVFFVAAVVVLFYFEPNVICTEEFLSPQIIQNVITILKLKLSTIEPSQANFRMVGKTTC